MKEIILPNNQTISVNGVQAFYVDGDNFYDKDRNLIAAMKPRVRQEVQVNEKDGIISFTVPSRFDPDK